MYLVSALVATWNFVASVQPWWPIKTMPLEKKTTK